jgi:hypothetical protein
MYLLPGCSDPYKKKNEKGGDWGEFEQHLIAEELANAKQKQDERKQVRERHSQVL